MDYDLRNYVKIYDGFLNSHECDLALTNLQNEAEWSSHTYYDSHTGIKHTTDNEFDISNSDVEIKSVINKRLWFALEKYILKDFDHLYWFGKWNDYTSVRFNRYTQNTSMKIHCDHIHSLFNGNRKGVPILTMLGLLNDDFEGGEFVMWDEQTINLNAGSLVVFPSNFLYPHNVQSITRGTRYSFVSWCW